MKKLIIIWLTILTIFVLWTHFVPDISSVYHHFFISASSRIDVWSGCKMTPKIWWEWEGMRIREYSTINNECFEKAKENNG